MTSASVKVTALCQIKYTKAKNVNNFDNNDKILEKKQTKMSTATAKQIEY